MFNSNPILRLSVLVCAFFMLASSANADSPREQLKQMVEQLQGLPNDDALREKIIALAVTVNPRPATPQAATLAEGAAVYAFKHAQSNSDYSDAARQYEKALLLAPWLAADYYNAGVAHEKAGENKEAIRSFNLYLLAAPNAPDTQAITMRIGGLQYAAQKAEDEANSPAAKLEKFINTLDGGVWRISHRLSVNTDGSRVTDSDIGHEYIAISGHTISYYILIKAVNGDMSQHWKRVDFDPYAKPDWTGTLTGYKFDNSSPPNRDELTISENGRLITEESRSVYPGGTAYQTDTFERIK